MSLADGPTIWSLRLDTTECNGAAWWCLDVDLLRPSIDKRGGSLLVPGVAGQRPRKRIPDERTELLEFLFTGNVDPSGVPSSDPAAQLQDNLDAFITAVVNHTTDTITATVTGPGVVYSGDVQVVKFRPGRGLYECPAALTLVIPSGTLEVTGS
jgi:hypothetical protein